MAIILQTVTNTPIFERIFTPFFVIMRQTFKREIEIFKSKKKILYTLSEMLKISEMDYRNIALGVAFEL